VTGRDKRRLGKRNDEKKHNLIPNRPRLGEARVERRRKRSRKKKRRKEIAAGEKN